MNSYRLPLLATLDIIKVALPAERRVVGYGEREHGCATLVELDLQRLRGVRRECTHILLQRQPSRLARILASHKDLQVGSGRSDWARKGQHDVHTCHDQAVTCSRSLVGIAASKENLILS